MRGPPKSALQCDSQSHQSLCAKSARMNVSSAFTRCAFASGSEEISITVCSTLQHLAFHIPKQQRRSNRRLQVPAEREYLDRRYLRSFSSNMRAGSLPFEPPYSSDDHLKSTRGQKWPCVTKGKPNLDIQVNHADGVGIETLHDGSSAVLGFRVWYLFREHAPLARCAAPNSVCRPLVN